MGSPGPVLLPEPGGLFLDAQDQPEGTAPPIGQVCPASAQGAGGVPGHPLTRDPPEHDTDSDSDLSLDDPSGSYGSTHSSDSEDEAPCGWDPLPGAPPGPPSPGSTPRGQPVEMGDLQPGWVLRGGHPMGWGRSFASSRMLMGGTCPVWGGDGDTEWIWWGVHHLGWVLMQGTPSEHGIPCPAWGADRDTQWV